MTTLAKLAIAVLMALLFSSCGFDVNFNNGKKGNGTVVEDTREITGEFTIVSASEGLDVYVTQSNKFSIHVEADENIITLIGTDIKNGKLHIHAIENIGRATKKVYVSLPIIEGLRSSSGAELMVKNTIEVDEIAIDASSGSDIIVSLKADRVTANTSSGAGIKLSGQTNRLHVDASSGSDIKAKNLLAKICDADASSGAGITINVSESLVADASSGADIKYSGDASVRKNKSASGSVRKY
ncbi:MAG: head GIN domain-containing protein [Cellulophaga sp.]